MRIIKSAVILISFLTAVTFTSCAKSAGYNYIEGKINIVTTTTMLADLAREIGGEHVSVTALMKTGIDPHSYQPKPSDLRALGRADLVVINGLHLEARMGEVIRRIGGKVFVAGDYVSKDKLLTDEDTGAADPHIWFDIGIWKDVAAALCQKLADTDAQNAQSYTEAAESYTIQLNQTHEYVLSKVVQLDISRRVLVTAHDAFRYFAQSYGFEVHSIQGISTQTEAGALDIQQLANLVTRLKVKAVFLESSVPQETINSVISASRAQGHTVIIGGNLYSDSLGDVVSGTETYIKTIIHNADTIVDALK